MQQSLLVVSLICLIIALFLFLLTFFFFHFVTNKGITFVFQKQAGKPLLTNMVAMLSVLFFFASIFTLILAYVVF